MTDTHASPAAAESRADAALDLHITAERECQANDPPDARPIHALSASRLRFRAGNEDDLAAVRQRVEMLCRGELWRSEMTRTYLDHDYAWRVHDGDLFLPDGVACFDFPLIVTGNLECDAYLDEDNVVIVMGSLRCAEMYSSAGLCVLGDVIVGGTMLHHYNDWAFECLGKVSARAFVSEDKSTSFSREKSVIEYYSHDHSGESEEKDAAAWLALDAEQGAEEHVQVLRNAYAHGRDPLPAPPPPAERAKTLGEFDAMQRAIAEGRLDLTEAAAAMSHPDWGRDMAALWPSLKWTPELVSQALMHPDATVRARIASRLGAQHENAFAVLVKDLLPAVRAEAALNAHCPEAHWQDLADDRDMSVRANLVYGRYAAHQTLPVALQILLAPDLDARVRRAVAVLPGLDADSVALLRQDADVIVRKRVNALQPMPANTVLKQADDRDASVRANLAAAAVWGRAPFDAHPAMREEVMQKLLFDTDASVRRAAALRQSPPFVETHQQRLAADAVPEVRRLVASITRDAALQRRLADDPDMSVRLAVVENPHAHADVLVDLARNLPKGGVFDMGEGIMELAKHPRLPVEAVEILDDRMSQTFTRLFDEQPSTPVRVMVARFCHDLPYSPGEWEYDDYQRCRSTFPELLVMEEAMADADHEEGLGVRLMRKGMSFPRRWYHKPMLMAGVFAMMFGALFKTRRKFHQAAKAGRLTPVDDAAIDALFDHMLNSKLYELNRAALGNVRCPPARLAQYVADYLAKESDDTDYTVEYVAANPSLPLASMTDIAERLVTHHDHELRTGFLRNPKVPQVLLRRLLNSSEADTRNEARRALWSWHGEYLG